MAKKCHMDANCSTPHAHLVARGWLHEFKAAVAERGDSSNSLAVVPDVIQQQIKALKTWRLVAPICDGSAVIQR